MRDGRSVTVEVTADGAGLVSHAGTALLGQIADKVGLTSALSVRLAGLKQRRRGHDPGRVIRDTARLPGTSQWPGQDSNLRATDYEGLQRGAIARAYWELGGLRSSD